MTPEGKVKIWMMNQIDKRYGHLAVWKYAPPGGYFGQNGTADRLLLIPSDKSEDEGFFAEFGRPAGVFAAIELKAEGNDLSPLQKRKLEEVHRAGGVAAVLIGKDFAKMSQIFDQIELRRETNRRGWLDMIRTVRVKQTLDKIEG